MHASYSFLFVIHPAVGNSPLFLDESPFRRIRQFLEPPSVVQTFDEFSEMEIRPKIGVSCRRLNPSLQDFTKDSINPYLLDDACMHRMRAVCNPSLQDFTKDSINPPSLMIHTCMHRMLARPLNPRFPIYRLCLKTTFRSRMSIFTSGISGSDARGL